MAQESWKIYIPYAQIQDLPENLQPVARIMGLETFMELLEYSGGTTLYFFKPDKLIVKARSRMICKDFPLLSTGELAKKYRVSDTWIRQILKNEQAKKRGGEKG